MICLSRQKNLDSYAGTALRDSSKIQRKLDLSREKLRITALYNIRIHHFPCQSFRAQVAICIVIGCVGDILFHEENQNRETSWQIYFVIKIWHLIDMRSQSIFMTIMDTNGFFRIVLSKQFVICYVHLHECRNQFYFIYQYRRFLVDFRFVTSQWAFWYLDHSCNNEDDVASALGIAILIRPLYIESIRRLALHYWGHLTLSQTFHSVVVQFSNESCPHICLATSLVAWGFCKCQSRHISAKTKRPFPLT